jgi:hypothetical protein
MKILKAVIYLLAAIGLGTLLFVAFISFGPIPNCDVTVLRVAISPTKQHEARLEVGKCEGKNPELNLFIFNTSKPNVRKGAPIAAPTTTDIDLTWISNDRLQVSYPVSLQLAQQPSDIDGIAIIFVAKPSANSSFNADTYRRAN